MKKILLSILLVFGALFAADFDKKAQNNPTFVQSGEGKEFCPVCGMSLKNYYKTSYTYEKDGKNFQYCSMRCLISDNKNLDIDKIKVVDAKTEKLINAKNAFYVIKSDVPGTMAKFSKLAFENENDAKEFSKNHGGEVVNFAAALELAKKSIKEDNIQRMQKLKKTKIPMGEKIYKSKCEKIDSKEFKKSNELKAEVYKKCKNLDEKQAQAVTLYLNFEKSKSQNEDFNLTKEDKCPICGMFVYKFPRWASVIYLQDKKHLAFDGMKDLMKYYLKNKDLKYSKILTRDYYTQKIIDAKNAYFVMGSDVLGPMGNELIAFEDLENAKEFKLDHKGINILQFNAIDNDIICKLDGVKCN